MKRKSLGLWIVTTAVVSGVMMLPPAVASEEEPEPARSEEQQSAAEDAAAPATDAAVPTLGSAKQSTKTNGESSSPASRPRTLADLASGIDLNSPGEGTTDSIVITNQNLQSMGKGAVISEGSNIGGSPTQRGWFVPPSARGPAADGDDIDAARRQVELLEGQAEAINKAVEENQTANMYTGGGPQYRAPGVTDPLRDQQQDVNKQLADARARLSDMERAAAAAARSEANSGSTSPSPSSADDDGE